MERKTGTIVLFAAFAIALLLSGCTAPGGSQKSIWAADWGWEGLTGIALAVMAMLLGIAYMASTLLGDEQMRAWTKREVGQLAYSAIILVVAVLLVGNMEGWLKLLSSASASPGWQAYVNTVVCCDPAQTVCVMSDALAKSRPCHIALATDYLQILYESARAQVNYNLFKYWIYAFTSNLAVSLKLIALVDIGDVSVKPLGWLSINSEFYSVLLDLGFKTMMFIRVQQVLLDYLTVAFFPLMMSMGLVLRAFHFSRKLGGMLVALGLSLSVVLPMFYVLSGAILFGFMGDWATRSFSNSLDKDTVLLPGVNNADLNAPGSSEDAFRQPLNAIDICGTAPESQGNEMGSVVDTLQGQVNQLTSNNWLEEITTDGLLITRFDPDGPIGNMAMLMVLTLISPFIGLMTTLAAFKYFSPLIGGDVEISVLSRLI